MPLRTQSVRIVTSVLAFSCLTFLIFTSVSANNFISRPLAKFDNSFEKKLGTIENKTIKEEDNESLFSCGDPITDRDGYTYNTVNVGGECWMAENLRTKTKSDGTPLTNLDDNAERDCISSSGDERGAEVDCDAGRTLYTLNAATNSNTGSFSEGAQGLCPDGWHLPTDSEWHTLETSLSDDGSGPSCDPNRSNDACAGAGTKMLSGGSSGLNLNFVGMRVMSNYPNEFIGWNSVANFWSSTEKERAVAYGRGIPDYNHSLVGRWYWGGSGESLPVRCIMNNPVPPISCGSLLEDRDGYTYNTVQIGDQCWMSENLKTKTYPNGDCINGSDYPCTSASEADNYKARSCYNNSEISCETDGALYSWYGAMNIEGDSENPGFNKPGPNPYTVWENLQGICPSGWHIPTPDDFTTLSRSACATGSGDCSVFPFGPEATGTFGSNEGNKLISGTIGFNAKLAGMRTTDYITSMQRGQIAYLWGAAFNGSISNQAYRISITQAPVSSGIERKYTARWRNYPVRCVQN